MGRRAIRLRAASLLILDPVRPSVSEELGRMGVALEHRGAETVPEALNRVRPEIVLVRSSQLKDRGAEPPFLRESFGVSSKG